MGDKPTAEDKIKSDLESVEVMLRKLGPIFPNTLDLAAAIRLALGDGEEQPGNEGQFKLLFLWMTRK